MLAHSLFPEREHAIHIYIYILREISHFLCANEHISVREERSQEGIIEETETKNSSLTERERAGEKSFSQLLYMYCFFYQKSK
jgi:hypothetical protein